MQLRLRDETIYQLKQEIVSLKTEKDSTIFLLEGRIKELKSQSLLAPIKEKGMHNFFLVCDMMCINS